MSNTLQAFALYRALEIPCLTFPNCRTMALGRITRGSHIPYYSIMFLIAYTFKGQVHVFTGFVKIVSHSSCRTSAIVKYFVPCEVCYNETFKVSDY